MNLVGGGEPLEKKGGPFGNSISFTPLGLFCNNIPDTGKSPEFEAPNKNFFCLSTHHPLQKSLIY